MSFSDKIALGTLALGVLLALVGFLKFVWPGVRWFARSLVETLTTINGKPAKVDKSGRVTEPATPSLAAHLIDLKQTIQDQATQDRRLTAIEETQSQHGARLDRLEDRAQLERLAARADSVSAFKAIEAVAKQEQKPDDN